MVHARRIGIFIGLIFLYTSAFAQNFELVRPSDFRYYVTVDGDTLSNRSLDYKSIQDAIYYKCQTPDAVVIVEPIGMEARGCPMTNPEIEYIDFPVVVYEEMIRTVSWEHRQSEQDLHTITIDVDHSADSLIIWIEACNQMWYSGEQIPCNEMARIFVEGIKEERTVIVRDSIDLADFNDFFINNME